MDKIPVHELAHALRLNNTVGGKVVRYMSMVLWILEEGLEGDSSTPDLWALYHFKGELDTICDAAGVSKLTTFHDLSVMAAEFNKELEPKLSDAAALLASLTKIRDVVVNGGRQFSLDGVDRTSDVVRDLDETIRVATECIAKSKRVRLSVIP
jgi:hypothetical protein